MAALALSGPVAATLALAFVRKLCDRLEGNGALKPGEAGRIWADIARELQGDVRALSRESLTELLKLELAKK